MLGHFKFNWPFAQIKTLYNCIFITNHKMVNVMLCSSTIHDCCAFFYDNFTDNTFGQYITRDPMMTSVIYLDNKVAQRLLQWTRASLYNEVPCLYGKPIVI